MVLEKLSSSLKDTLHKIAKAVFVDDTLLNELVKDIQRALLQADVNVKLVLDLTNTIKERAKKEESPKGLTKKEHLIKIVYDELVKFLGGEKHELNLEQSPSIILLVGLYGSGKTTSAGKIAKYYVKRGKKVALLGLDVHRTAAMQQLEQIGNSIHVPVMVEHTKKDAVSIINKFRQQFSSYDMLIVDSSGRDALSQDLITEISDVKHELNPKEILLVISADIGQAAQKQAQTFHDSLGITGVVVTKMDGTAKGGGALTACSVTQAPIVFIGTGEKVDDLELFNPKGFVGRILGMGDIEALLEKAKEAISEEEAKDLEKKLFKGEFTLIDLYEQMEAMKKMGPLSKIVEMIPGFGQVKMPKEMLDVQEENLKKWKHAMNSMTKKELENPEIIDSNRITRISSGSGILTNDIRDLIKQYRQGKKMLKMLKGTKSPEVLMKKFKGKMPKMI